MSWEVLVAAPSTLLLIRKNPPSINFTIYTHKMDTIHLGESDVSSFFHGFWSSIKNHADFLHGR